MTSYLNLASAYIFFSFFSFLQLNHYASDPLLPKIKYFHIQQDFTCEGNLFLSLLLKKNISNIIFNELLYTKYIPEDKNC